MELKVGFVCDRGLNPRRPVNQDRFLAVPARGLFAVFDGVGGQRAGEVASQTAAETIEEALAHTSADSSTELIRRAIEFANRDIFEMAESDPAYKTMATTVALIHIVGSQATVAHVGDSRVYRLEEGHFCRETIDHTDLYDDLRAGISSSKGAEAAGRNVINRALGSEPGVDVEIKTINVREGVRFLLCSDGIYRHLGDEEIARVLAENKDPQRAADELKRIVIERGADDNLTAVVVQVGRARQSKVLAVEDAMAGEKQSSTRAEGAGKAARAGLTGSGRGGRIQVDFNSGARGAEADLVARRQPAGDWPPNRERAPIALPESSLKRSGTHKLIYTLLALVVIAAAFYAGLRASDLIDGQSSKTVPPHALLDPLKSGREAFESGNYPMAALEFDSIVKREPQNGRALYWLGRTQLEQREYAKAAASFEQAVSIQPALHDGYVQAAAAYEALGEKAKAAKLLARYGEERRKIDQPAPPR